MAFKEIKTQEEFDEMVKSRIERVKAQYEGYLSPEQVSQLKQDYESKLQNVKNYDGYTSPEELETLKQGYQTQIDDLTKNNNDLKLSQLKQDTAYKFGIPREMANRLQGTDVESLEKDAELFSKYSSRKQTAPMSNTDDHIGKKDNMTQYKTLLHSLKGED